MLAPACGARALILADAGGHGRSGTYRVLVPSIASISEYEKQFADVMGHQRGADRGEVLCLVLNDGATFSSLEGCPVALLADDGETFTALNGCAIVELAAGYDEEDPLRRCSKLISSASR